MDKPRAAARRAAGRPAGRLLVKFDEAPESDTERWLPVADYEGLYEVSDLGRVCGLPGLGHKSTIILRPQVKRYLTVNLWRDGKMRTVTVHSLVARAFLGPRPDGMEVCHGPAGGLENGVANLYYGTPAQNLGPDKYRDGTIQQGTRNGKAKLNDEAVREIRARAATGESHHSISRRFAVCRPTIDSVVKGATWRHVPLAG